MPQNMYPFMLDTVICVYFSQLLKKDTYLIFIKNILTIMNNLKSDIQKEQKDNASHHTFGNLFLLDLIIIVS